MTLRQSPSIWFVLAILALAAVVAAYVILRYAGPTRERPADLTPTPTLRVIVEPTRPIAQPSSLTPTMPTPERLLLTPVIVPAPTRTPTVEPTPTETPTQKPERTAVQRG